MKILTKRHWKVFFGMICKSLLFSKKKRETQVGSIKSSFLSFFFSGMDISSVGRENGVAWH